jgi:hypothetical protein
MEEIRDLACGVTLQAGQAKAPGVCRGLGEGRGGSQPSRLTAGRPGATFASLRAFT